MMGPLEFIIIGFDGNRFSGDIVRELDDVRSKGIVRIIDLIVVAKNADGEVISREVSDLDDDEAGALGMVDENPDDDIDHYGWFSEDDLDAIAEELEPNTSAALVLFEHLWAAKLRAAVLNAGGFLVAQGRVPGELVDEVEALVREQAS